MKVENIKADFFCNQLIQSGFGPFTGVPCSILKHLINYIEESENVQYYLMSSEGEAMRLAGGFALSGKIPNTRGIRGMGGYCLFQQRGFKAKYIMKTNSL